jgi:hypothetical protein
MLVPEPDFWIGSLIADGLAAGHEVVGLVPTVAAALALATDVASEEALVARDLGQGSGGTAAVPLQRERYGCPALLTADRLDEDGTVRAAAPGACVLRSADAHTLLPAIEAARAAWVALRQPAA